MYAITIKEMKFGDLYVPARTKCLIVSELDFDSVNNPEKVIKIMIESYFLGELSKNNSLPTGHAILSGYTISTTLKNVFLDVSHNLFSSREVTNMELEKVFGKDNIPKILQKVSRVELFDLIYLMEKEFSAWIDKNCSFYSVKEEDVINGEYASFNVGDKILSSESIDLYFDKKQEYQNKLENIGLTYNFKGSLIFE